ncbi:hypothetical protein DFH29DRAFT_188674 [Suillus ampliporus]|nr:hypothetical protein DFH29DRAFT_188674 [Suillus ampliporus]
MIQLAKSIPSFLTVIWDLLGCFSHARHQNQTFIRGHDYLPSSSWEGTTGVRSWAYDSLTQAITDRAPGPSYAHNLSQSSG